MSVYFPNVDLDALSRFAAKTAAAEHLKENPNTRPVRPRIIALTDIDWAGEKMIMISFDPLSMPLGPHSMMACFPDGRPRVSTQALVGMTAAVRRRRSTLAPKVYAFRDYKTGDPLRFHPITDTVVQVGTNDIGQEVVLLEKLPGRSLKAVWSKLTPEQRKTVCIKLVDILLDLFQARGSHIGTDLLGTCVDTRSDGDHGSLEIPGSVLMHRAFNDGPLGSQELPAAVSTVDQYLAALGARVDRVFNSDPISNIRGRDGGWFRETPLTDEDVSRAVRTWRRLQTLSRYHTGGFYLSPDMSEENRSKALGILTQESYGVYHSDMRMDRFLISFASLAAGGSSPDFTLTLATGWEFAGRAPAWSCTRLPSWLEDVPLPIPSPISQDCRRELRSLIIDHLNASACAPESTPALRSSAHDWICCFVFGIRERLFEGLLSTHWALHRTVEVCIAKLKASWEEARPDVQFPLNVECERGSREDSVNTHTLFLESIDALARASRTSAEDWDLVVPGSQH